MSNAEKQAAWQAQRDAELAELRAEVARLKRAASHPTDKPEAPAPSKPEPVAVADAERAYTEAIAELEPLPKTVQRIATRALEKAYDAQNVVFWATVRAKVSIEVEAQQHALESIHRANAMRDEYLAKVKYLDEWMTEAEFKFVLGCLRPDKRDRSAESLAKAFQIFNRLEQPLSRDVRTRRKNKWPTFADRPVWKRQRR